MQQSNQPVMLHQKKTGSGRSRFFNYAGCDLPVPIQPFANIMGDYTCCDRYDNCSNQICHCYTPFPLERITAFLLCLKLIVVSMCRRFVFAALLRRCLLLLLMGDIIGVQKDRVLSLTCGARKTKTGSCNSRFFNCAGCERYLPVQPLADVIRNYTCYDR